MNNGSVLDSLLAVNRASPVTKKTTQAQNAASSADGFQSTLDQLRPEVAARKKVEPRESPAEARARAVQSKSTASAKRDSPAQVADRAREPTPARAGRSEAADTALTTAQTATVKNKSETDSSATDDDLSVERNALDVVQASESPDAAQASLLAAALTGMTGTGEEVDVELEENPDETLLSLELIPEMVGAELLPGSVLNPAVQTEAILPSVLANQIATAGGVAGLSPLNGVSANSLPVGLLNPDALADAEGMEVALTQEADAELLLVDGEVSDNPDLLLLNAKTVMNKLAEANANSLDKAAPAGDLSKALTAAAPAVESLSRLSEAQSPAARAFVVQTGVPVTLGQPQWGQAVGERVLWLAAQNVSAAEIRLDPPELGPMQVRVSVNQEQVSVSFTSPNPAVREVLDQQLSRLREMFSEQGLNLVDVDVSDKSFAQQDQERGESNKNKSSQLEDEELAPLTSSILVSNRLVDHYA